MKDWKTTTRTNQRSGSKQKQQQREEERQKEMEEGDKQIVFIQPNSVKAKKNSLMENFDPTPCAFRKIRMENTMIPMIRKKNTTFCCCRSLSIVVDDRFRFSCWFVCCLMGEKERERGGNKQQWMTPGLLATQLKVRAMNPPIVIKLIPT